MSKQIILLRGLPGSGKSFWAKQVVKNNPGQYKRINKDDLREMLDGGRRSKKNEKMVLDIRNQLITDSLVEGFNVIVDDTNFLPAHEETIRHIAKNYNATVEVKFFDTPVWECIERDSKRANPVGRQVIMDMYEKYLQPKKIQRQENLPECIIVDVDGTLAQKGDRNIYDDSKLYLDTVIEPVKYFVNKYPERVIVVSGRTDTCKEQTIARLEENGILFNEIHMRKEGDDRCDTIVKKEIYEEFIKGKYNVRGVFDDRLKVVRMRVEQGLFVFNCNQFLIEF